MRPPDPLSRPGDEGTALEGTFLELRLIWVNATGDSVGRDIARARELVEQVPPERQADAMEFVVALERLARWLRDF